VKAINPNEEFIRYIHYGGESISILINSKITKKEYLLKVALPFFDGIGKRTVYIESQKRGDYEVKTRNNFKCGFWKERSYRKG